MNLHVRNAIRKRYGAPAFAVFFEVGNATGFRCSRHADAVAMSIWPSRGLEVIGIECKASRSDWTRERDNPAKAESIQKYCDRWFLLTENAAILRDGELPTTWGHLTMRGKVIHQLVDAPKLTPEPLTRSFVAAMLRRANEDRPGRDEINAAVEERLKEAQASWERMHAHQQVRDMQELKELREQVAAFTAASGISIGRYTDGAELGRLVKCVEDLTSARGFRSRMNALQSNAKELRATADSIDTLAATIRESVGVEKVVAA